MNPVNILSLSNAIVLDERNQEIKISSLWKSNTVIFIFLRHFACIACRSHAMQVWKDREKYEKNGGRIIFIGNGLPGYIKFFKEDLGIQNAPIYTDPSLLSFKAAGFKYGFRSLVSTQSVKNFLKLKKEGYSQGKFNAETGVHWQLGGIIVIKTNSEVVYYYMSESLGDFPPEKDVESERI